MQCVAQTEALGLPLDYLEEKKTTLASGSHYARLEGEEGMQACHLVMSMLFTLIKMWGFFPIILNYFVLKRFE